MSRLFNKLIRSYLELKKPKDIQKAQWKTLKRKLKLFENTRIGKRYKFSEIKSISDYQKMVPVHDYDSIKEYLSVAPDDNRKNGVVSYALTTGTTGTNKLIPLTKKSLKDVQLAQKHAISIFLYKLPGFELLKKKFYTVGGKSNIGVSDDGIGFGMASGLNIKYLSPLLKKYFLPGLELNDCADISYRNKAISRIVRNNRIGVFIGIPGAFVDFLINLKSVLDDDSYKLFCSNVEAFLSSGSNYRAYENEIFGLLGKRIDFVDMYACSEGYLGYESDADSNYMELFSTLNFYEFIPLDEYYKGEYTNRCLITELKDGVDYAILITTSAGVFSYIVGDIVRCVNAKECRVKLIGRTKLTINFSTEKVTISDVEETIMRVSERFNDSPKDFFVTAYLYKSKPVYHWFVVNNSTWQQYDKQAVANALDEELCKVNVMYNTVMKAKIIRPCTVSYIDYQCIENWFESKNSDRWHRKLPRLIPDLKIVEDIIGEDVLKSAEFAGN
jgi:hypothetical protein